MAAGLVKVQVKIANAGTLSGEIDLSQYQVLAIQAPPAWTAAALTFKARATKDALQDGSTPVAGEVVDDAGAVVTVSAAALAVASGYIVPTTASLRNALASVKFLTIRSGTSGVPVAQGADRFLVLVCKPVLG